MTARPSAAERRPRLHHTDRPEPTQEDAVCAYRGCQPVRSVEGLTHARVEAVEPVRTRVGTALRPVATTCR